MSPLPTLYKKSNSQAVLEWHISAGVRESDGAGTITVTHGQVGGKLQTGVDYVTEGKNPSKKNATTPVEQAAKECRNRWTKQKKKGYVETYAAAEAGELDAVIEGGILPQLSPNKSYPGDGDLVKAIVFPCYQQPKLDGMRSTAIIDDGVCTLWTRTRKRIQTAPHIIEALEKAFPDGHIILDGELYNHEYKDRFEDLLSLLRGDEPDADGEYLNAQFHTYDCPEVKATIPNAHLIGSMSSDFEHRLGSLKVLSTQFPYIGPIKLVETREIHSMEQLVAGFENYEELGYEGAMARNKHGIYESGKRSKHVQKMKRFTDHEFRIIGIEDGRGKDAGTVAKFVCITAPGTYPTDEKGAPLAGEEPKEFKARLKATYARRRELMQKPEQWQNKKLTVRFKRWTAEKVPYIPVGQGIRDYE